MGWFDKIKKAAEVVKAKGQTTTANTAGETPPTASPQTSDNSMVSSGSVNKDYAGLFDQLINKDPNSSATGMALNAEILQGLSGQGSSALHNAKRMGAEMLSRKAQDLRGQAGEQIAQAGLVGQGAGNAIGNKAEGAILQATADLGNNIAQQASTEQMAAQKMALDKGALDESSRDNTLSKLLQNKSANQSAAQDLYKQYADARDKGDTANAAMIDKKYIEMTGFSADQIQAGKTAGADAQVSNKIMQDTLGLISSNPDALKNATYDKATQSWTVNGEKITDQNAVAKISELKYAQNEAQGTSEYAASQVLQEKGIAAMTSDQLAKLPKSDLDSNTIMNFKDIPDTYTIGNDLLEKGADGNPSLNDSQMTALYGKFGLGADGKSSEKLVLIDGTYYKASSNTTQTDRGAGKPDLRSVDVMLTPVKGNGPAKTLKFSGFNNNNSVAKHSLFGNNRMSATGFDFS